ncbi:MAG: membrane protein insertion efficiency factor YidD [Elusimicrobia bacterium]|nr:membrane protein insertion efficiency factor YidD [Elusimicrobiota bacterium]
MRFRPPFLISFTGHGFYQTLLLELLDFLRLFRKVLAPPACRFHPSCSEYATEAILKHGALLGLFLFFQRLSRCHPWCAGGPEPVPPAANLSWRRIFF